MPASILRVENLFETCDQQHIKDQKALFYLSVSGERRLIVLREFWCFFLNTDFREMSGCKILFP